MDGDLTPIEIRRLMAHETGRPCSGPHRTGGSLAHLVELLAAMKEAGWVKDAPFVPGSPLADFAEMSTPATNTGGDCQ